MSVHCVPEHFIPDKVTIKFEVTDTGIGMKKEALERLFQRFYQVSSSLNYFSYEYFKLDVKIKILKT